MVRPEALSLLIAKYIGVVIRHFHVVVLIRVRSEELRFVGQEVERFK